MQNKLTAEDLIPGLKVNYKAGKGYRPAYILTVLPSGKIALLRWVSSAQSMGGWDWEYAEITRGRKEDIFPASEEVWGVIEPIVEHQNLRRIRPRGLEALVPMETLLLVLSKAGR